MARTVFILGAGASAHTGAPVMGDFLRRIRDTSRMPEASKHSADFELVLRAYEQLQIARVKVRIDYEENIENLYASFEMARVLGFLGDLDEDEIAALPRAMRRVISSTIEISMPFPSRGGKIHPHDPYVSFAGKIKTYVERRGSADLAIITFNYDIGLDFALSYVGVDYGYFLEFKPGRAPVRLLKLHGSLNWAVCPDPESIIPIPMSHYLGKLASSANEQERMIQVSEELDLASGCNGEIESEPFMVPPTWNKTEYHSQISYVWTTAARELAEAESIVLIGYSVPETDEFFRHLFALGLSGGTIVDRIVVINPTERAANTLKKMVGDPLLATIEPVNRPFFDSLDIVSNILSQ